MPGQTRKIRRNAVIVRPTTRAVVVAPRRPRGRRPFAMKSRAPIVKLVRAIMKREEETKYVANQYNAALAPLANQWYSVGSLAAAGSWFPALPALGQGTGDYQRVGSKIQPVSAAVSLKVFFDPQNIEAASLYGVIYYGTSKSVKSYNAGLPIGNQQILDQGDGTNTTFNGDIYKLNHPIDKKQFNLKRIVFRLTKTPGIQNSDLSGNDVAGGNYSTANGLECRNFLLKLRPPKNMMYEANTDVWPSNYAPVYGVGFCHADGSPLTVADQTLVKVSSHCHMYFKDA